MKNNEHCIYCGAGMPIFDDCEIGIVVYPNSVQPYMWKKNKKRRRKIINNT